ncbi:MAG: glycosyltransferase family 4 protein, partial [Pyrinomonadaceae bacterium]
MRVGLDGYPLATPRTGIGHYTFELARALAALSPDDQFELVSPVPFTSSILEEIASANLRGVTADVPLRGRWWAAGLPLYFRRASLDIFHGTNYDIPLWNRRRTAVTIHDLSLLLHADKHQLHLVRRARRRLRLMAKLATMIITATETVKQEICQNLHVGSDKVAVTPYAARASFRPVPFEKTLETRQRLGVEDEFILFVGTLEPRKNLLTLARAFTEVLGHAPASPQLVVVGAEGWLMDDLFSFVRNSGISKRLQFTGYVSDED